MAEPASDAPGAWDNIEGIVDPLASPCLHGHRGALDSLCRRHASGRLHHAWLITGPRGIGKASFALAFAGHVLRHPDPAEAPEIYVEPDAGDPVTRQISGLAHPGLLLLRRPWDMKGKKWRTELTVEEVRRTQSFFGTTAAKGSWRVTIVDTADDLNRFAANALLKILEEPPPRTVFLILAHSASGAMATIRSRCQKLALKPLARPELEAVLADRDVALPADGHDLDLLHRLSGGSARRAIELIQQDGLAFYRQFHALSEACLQRDARTDWPAIHAFADNAVSGGRGGGKGGGGGGRFDLFLDLVEHHAWRQVRSEENEAPDKPIGELYLWTELWEKTRRGARRADAYNLDRKQVILNLFDALDTAGAG